MMPASMTDYREQKYRVPYAYCEDWAAIDAAIWWKTDPATGGPWTLYASGISSSGALYCTPYAGEVGSIGMYTAWPSCASIMGLVSKGVLTSFNLEMEIMWADAEYIDEAITMWGCGGESGRGDNDTFGFAVSGGALQTYTDHAGVETVNTGFGETLAGVISRYGISVRPSGVHFYLNGSLIAVHTTNIPQLYSMPMVVIKAKADTPPVLGPCVYLGMVGVW
jgi:hypothetical protein